MTTASDKDFDFERWSKLASADPDRFEAERSEAIAELIEQAAPEVKRRMVGLQWRIDRVREQAPNPLAACVRMSSMMWDSLLGKNGLLETMDRLARLDTRALGRDRGATVLPFKPGSKSPAAGDGATGRDGGAGAP